MTSLLYQNVAEYIAKAEHVLLLTDERIDGDTMGSTMGLYHVLQGLGKKIDVFSPKPLSVTFSYLPSVDVIRRDPEVFKQESIDLVIICDCSDGAYIQKLLPTMPHKVPLIVFDHHATNPLYGTVNVVESKAASTADVVWRFIKTMRWNISPEAAQCILTGICTDTVLFSTPNTTTDAFDASAELVKLGANLPQIVRHNLMNRSVTALKLWGVAMERLFHDDELNATATAITQKDLKTYGGTEEDVGGISGFLHSMLNDKHEVVVVYRETDDGAVKGSMRSRGRDVARLAEVKYGGGGHKLAAGFRIPNAHLVEKGGKWVIEKV